MPVSRNLSKLEYQNADNIRRNEEAFLANEIRLFYLMKAREAGKKRA